VTGSGAGAARGTRVLVCECAGTMAANVDFGVVERGIAEDGGLVERRRVWCGREGRARLAELAEDGSGERLVFVGCSADSVAQRFGNLAALGLDLEVADVREGCSWVHGEDRTAVTDKALRIARAAVRFPAARPRPAAPAARADSVVVVGGGVAGIATATELARMGHHVDLVEREAFLGGYATRIGTAYPTNDCGACLPTIEEQSGVRRCLFRNAAVDHPNLAIWRRTEVQSVSGEPGGFEVTLRQLPNMVTQDCVDCGLCEKACAVTGPDGEHKAIYSELFDGRVRWAVDLGSCTFCGACAEACPVEAIDFTQSPRLATIRAGAIVAATGCDPAPAELVAHLGYPAERVLTQTEFALVLDEWEERLWLDRPPVGEVVMVQCAGSRDLRRLPYCSRLCCTIALKHAIRLRRLFPTTRVTICYLELRTLGTEGESWYTAARAAGVEFLRGSPPRVELDADNRPVVEVEDVGAGVKRVLRPDLVVLSTGFVPSADTERVAGVLGARLDAAGFVDVLDAKNRVTETSAEGVFVCGSASGPKSLAESSTQASAAAGQVHRYLTSTSRRLGVVPTIDGSRCVGCDVCTGACPFGAVSLVARPGDAPRPAGLRDDAMIAVLDADRCRACGICAAHCPELAIAHGLDDETLLGRVRTLVEGADHPVVGFVCAECAGAAFSLAGVRRDRYPENVRLVELPCLGRVSALHLVEAARLGAAGVFLAGCAEDRCQYRGGDRSAAEQIAVAVELLTEASNPIPIEQWHLCAAERHTVGRRLRTFCAHAEKLAGERAAGADPALAGIGGGSS
jgi:heterodisulfide reductase subunit A-like polyferredoxin/coenzyme F420-reducing hydrogenase delta subunit